jgi:hypothetical protein
VFLKVSQSFPKSLANFEKIKKKIGKMDDPILVEGSAANVEAITEAVSNFKIMTAFISRIFSFFLCGFLQQSISSLHFGCFKKPRHQYFVSNL